MTRLTIRQNSVDPRNVTRVVARNIYAYNF